MSAPNILVVDDEPDIRELVKDILEDERYVVDTAEGAQAARDALRHRRPDLILLDIWMPDTDGISLLKEWEEGEGLPCPVIVMSGHGTVETAVEATRLGAYDFLEKPLSLAKLLLTCQRALETDRLQQENRGLQRQIRTHAEPVGHSAVMQRLREQIRRIAAHDTWVLITGEPGSGRETFARYLHHHSPRRDRPFVDLGGPTLSGKNAAPELFGSEEGRRVRYGALEQARGGTLYLSEVAEMPAEAQAQLLAALNTGSFVRVGGSDPVPFDARVVAATARNLEAEVHAGRFREDLFYHLNVVPLRIPPLREHKEDVPDLLAHYVDHFVAREKQPYRHFTVGAQNFLRNHEWPGNVQELRNLVQRLLILGAGEDIGQEEVEGAVGGRGAQQTPAGHGGPGVNLDQPLREARDDFERVYFLHQMERHEGAITRVADAAGIERTHLYRKLKALGIDYGSGGKRG